MTTKELIRAEIERLKEKLHAEYVLHRHTIKAVVSKLSIDNLDSLLSFIDSLQQGQPMPDSTKLIELWHEDKEMLKEKDFRNDQWRLAFNAFLCGFGRGIAVNKQEQPEVDLEKEIDRVFFQKDCGSDRLYHKEIAKIARHFYELGLKARKEE